jgi:DNA-binding PadR family transcriptional regulator
MLRARGKDTSIKLNYGSLYSVVTALEKQGYIEAVETLREGNRPERTVYAITDAGRAEFEDWLTELIGTPEKEFSQLEAGLAYMPAFAPDRVVELLEQRAKALEGQIAELVASHEAMQSQHLPRVFWVESEFRLELLTAELTFAQRLAAEIRADDLEGSAFWRKGFEIMAERGISPGELFKDPVKYFGEELAWLQEVPPEAK